MPESLSFEIREGDIETVVALSQQVPELTNPYAAEVYEKRLSAVPHLILVAWMGTSAAGFKVGYERDDDGSFYSWMGGMLPDFRRKGLAQALAEKQEKWALAQGYSTIRFKTRNRHKAMLLFALQNGFHLCSVEAWDDPAESRIWLEKPLMKRP